MFRDRRDAGKRLATILGKFANENCVIYALPRGGVPVGFEIAVELKTTLEALIVRKIGVPWQEELALGAIAEGDPPTLYFNEDLMQYLSLDRETLQPRIESKLNEIRTIQKLYRGNGKMFVDLSAIAILVDDGIATGATMKAAILALKQVGYSKIVIAVPVAQVAILQDFKEMGVEVVCVDQVSYLGAVGEFYRNFNQVSHEEVVKMMHEIKELVGKPA